MAIQVPTMTGPTVRQRPLGAPQVQIAPEANMLADLAKPLGNAAMSIYQKTQDEADTAALIEAESQMSSWKLNTMFNPQDGVYSRKGKNALDITNQTIPQFDQQAEQIGNTLTNERQRARWQQIVANQRQSLDAELNRYEFGERQVYFDQADAASLETSQNGALAYYQDPQQIAYYQNKATAVIVSQGQRKGLPPEAIELQVKKNNSAMATGVIGRMAQDDPMKAQQYYASVADYMTPEDQLRISETLGSSIRKQWGSQIGAAIYKDGTLSTDALPTLIIQAESSGQVDAIGPPDKDGVSALGLMQVRPGTAKEMAAELNIPYDEKRLTVDGNYNVALGTAYLNKMLGRYNGNSALAVAAYNAGPGSVDKWVKEYGDPRTGEISTADWVAKIPFEETRNYTGKIVSQLAPVEPASVRYSNAVTEANKIQDPELRKSVLDRVDDLKKADDIEMKANYDLAADAVMRGGYESVDARLLELMPPDDKLKLQKLDTDLRKGVEPVTDTEKFEQFLKMPTRQLAELSLNRDIRPYLSNSDFDKVTTAWKAARRGDASTQAAQAAEFSALKSVMNLAGIQFGTSKDAQSEQNIQARSQFENSYNRLRDAFVKKNGADPTPAEAQKIAEQLLVEVRMSGTGWFAPTKIPAWKVKPDEAQNAYIDPDDIDLDELTPNERQQALEQLRTNGVQQVSRETMTEAYLQILKARGLEVRR
ncbi:MAG: transglycosylase SLT domain-containing protein [Pseudomonas sp.]